MHSMRENLNFNAVTNSSSQPWWRFGGSSSMRGKVAIALVVAVTGGGFAASLTNSWFEGELNRYKLSMKKDVAPAPVMQKIVVASRSVKHGEQLTKRNTKLIDWAAPELPPSAFKATDTLFTDEGKRFALASIEPNEPILGSKITQPGKSASLSAQLSAGKKAVTIRVDDVLGVAGLIVPNDRVDILWTTKPDRGSKNKEAFTELLIPGVRVLALDQNRKDKSSKINVARAVTIEVDTRQAQQVALGSQTGKLHLALRGHGKENNPNVSFQRVSLSNLGSRSFFGGIQTVPVSTAKTIKFDPNDITAAISKPKKSAPRRRAGKVTITRGLESQDYDVVKTSSL